LRAFDKDTLIGIAIFYSEKFKKFKYKGTLVFVYCAPEYREQGDSNKINSTNN